MMKILLYGLLIWLLYNVIFRFIVPIYRTSKQMKAKFREMHDQMQRQANSQQAASPAAESPKSPSPKSAGDYIDFEEIK